MIKSRRNVRPIRAALNGIECLEGRALLSGVAHAAVTAAAAHQVPGAVAHHAASSSHAKAAAAAAAKAAAIPPKLVDSYLLRTGDTVTGLVMTFSKPLNPATAQDLNNYVVNPATPAAGNGNISSVVYDPTQDSITLFLAQPFTLNITRGAAAQEIVFVVENPHDSLGGSVSTITDTSGHRLQNKTDGFASFPGDLIAYFKAQGSSRKQDSGYVGSISGFVY